jgi:hypothetical protein
MKKNSVIQTTVVLCAAVLLSCVSGLAQDVKYNYMPGTNFSNYHTYQWVNIPGGIHPNQIVDQEIRQAVDSQLVAKGLTKSTSGTADLNVCYQVAIDQQRQWNAFGMGGGWRFGGMASATSSTIDNGTLVVDIYDVAKQQLVWNGSAAKTLNPSSNQQKNVQNLNKAIAKMMKNYPPPVKK